MRQPNPSLLLVRKLPYSLHEASFQFERGFKAH